MRGDNRLIVLVCVLSFVAIASAGLAGECGGDSQAAVCTSNAECGCGLDSKGECQLAAPECVSSSFECANFCGDYASVTAVCRSGRCIRAKPLCDADCDADTWVGIAELVSTVGIALGSQPLAACPTADRDGNMRIGIDELIAAVRTSLDGCAATLDAGAGQRRIYDATATFDDPERDVAALGITNVFAGQRTLTLHTSPNSNLFLSERGASSRLGGTYIETDIGVGVEGSVTITQEGDTELIEGTVTVEDPFLVTPPSSFTMRRATSLSPQRFAGRYEVTFGRSPSGVDGRSEATVDLHIGPNGTAIASEAADILETGLPAGTVSAADCMIAPEGSLYCRGVYLAADDPVNLFRMTGRLEIGPGGDAQGSGQFLAGYDPPRGRYVSGSWTAVSLDDPIPTPTATRTPEPTITPTSLLCALEFVARGVCGGWDPVWDFDYAIELPSGYLVQRESSAGHRIQVNLVRHQNADVAASEFAAQATHGEPTDFHELPAVYWERPFEFLDLGGRRFFLLWQLDCWVVLAHAFDDTSYRLAPHPVPFSETILALAGDLLRDACSQQ